MSIRFKLHCIQTDGEKMRAQICSIPIFTFTPEWRPFTTTPEKAITNVWDLDCSPYSHKERL